jgi:hypothetical protein
VQTGIAMAGLATRPVDDRRKDSIVSGRFWGGLRPFWDEITNAPLTAAPQEPAGRGKNGCRAAVNPSC